MPVRCHCRYFASSPKDLSLAQTAWLPCNDARPLCGVFLTGRLTVFPSSIHTQSAGCCAKFRWALLLRSECLTRPGVVATWDKILRNAQMRTLFRLETSAFSRLDITSCNHTIAACPCHPTVHVCLLLPSSKWCCCKSALLIFNVAHLDKRSLRASLMLRSTSLQRPPVAITMSDPELMSYLEGMKKKFWNERRHLQQDEIKLQWAARAAPYTSILLDTQAPIQPLELTSTQGHQMARQSTSKSWSEAASRRRASVRTHLHLAPSILEGADAGIGGRHSSRTWSMLL